MRVVSTGLVLLVGLMLLVTVGVYVVGPVAGEGQSIRVPQWEWVDIESPEPVSLRWGSRPTCGIEFGGKVTAIGAYTGRTLVRYTAPGLTGGTACKTGTLFFIDPARLARFDASYRAIQAEEQARSQVVWQLLMKEQ